MLTYLSQVDPFAYADIDAGLSGYDSTTSTNGQSGFTSNAAASGLTDVGYTVIGNNGSSYAEAYVTYYAEGSTFTSQNNNGTTLYSYFYSSSSSYASNIGGNTAFGYTDTNSVNTYSGFNSTSSSGSASTSSAYSTYGIIATTASNIVTSTISTSIIYTGDTRTVSSSVGYYSTATYTFSSTTVIGGTTDVTIISSIYLLASTTSSQVTWISFEGVSTTSEVRTTTSTNGSKYVASSTHSEFGTVTADLFFPFDTVCLIEASEMAWIATMLSGTLIDSLDNVGTFLITDFTLFVTDQYVSNSTQRAGGIYLPSEADTRTVVTISTTVTGTNVASDTTGTTVTLTQETFRQAYAGTFTLSGDTYEESTTSWITTTQSSSDASTFKGAPQTVTETINQTTTQNSSSIFMSSVFSDWKIEYGSGGLRGNRQSSVSTYVWSVITYDTSTYLTQSVLSSINFASNTTASNASTSSTFQSNSRDFTNDSGSWHEDASNSQAGGTTNGGTQAITLINDYTYNFPVWWAFTPVPLTPGYNSTAEPVAAQGFGQFNTAGSTDLVGRGSYLNIIDGPLDGFDFAIEEGGEIIPRIWGNILYEGTNELLCLKGTISGASTDYTQYDCVGSITGPVYLSHGWLTQMTVSITTNTSTTDTIASDEITGVIQLYLGDFSNVDIMTGNTTSSARYLHTCGGLQAVQSLSETVSRPVGLFRQTTASSGTFASGDDMTRTETDSTELATDELVVESSLLFVSVQDSSAYESGNVGPRQVAVFSKYPPGYAFSDPAYN
jgi:hypothetical protein